MASLPLPASAITSITSLCSCNRLFISLLAAGSSSITIVLNTWLIFHQFMNRNGYLFTRLIHKVDLMVAGKKKVQFIIHTLYAISGIQFTREKRTIICY